MIAFRTFITMVNKPVGDTSREVSDRADDGTLWALAPHTLGKHLVLRNYLNAWLPIMSRRNERILFIDGFAGPGRYAGGEDGSPVIALKALRDHDYRMKMNTEVTFFFIEDRYSRVERLSDEILPLTREVEALGSRIAVEVRHGKFDATMTEILDHVDEQRDLLAPAYVMVDPFGVSDTPMDVLERILKNPKSELYVSVMWEFMNRFRDTGEFAPHLDQLFGTSDWRPIFDEPNWRIRKGAIFELYRSQLKKRGAQHVTHFELYEGPVLKYAIFFATKHPLGCDKMKEAIWKVDPFAGHTFVPGSNDTLQLFAQADLSLLKQELRRRYGDRPTPCEEMCQWLMTDEVYFYSGQLKRVLREMEEEKLLSVKPGTRKRAKQFPDGTVVTLTPL